MLKKLLVGLVTLFASIGMALAAVNINTASEAELDALPGIGAAKAKAIVEYRKAHGDFKTVDDLKNVKGVGDKVFAKLKDQISVSGATTMPAATAKPAKVAKATKAAAADAASAPMDKKAARAAKKAAKAAASAPKAK